MVGEFTAKGLVYVHYHNQYDCGEVGKVQIKLRYAIKVEVDVR